VPLPTLFRVILPAGELETSVAFYAAVFEDPGVRVSPGRHYFHCGQTILAIVDPIADGNEEGGRPNSDHVYFSVPSLEPFRERVKQAGAAAEAISRRPWGEVSFYCHDPFGNPICFVEAGTEFTGR
jgi:catechol 2,3-dioxygenase-like lactoylglutathione lyase family enzyme